jgi:hypothetical protein
MTEETVLLPGGRRVEGTLEDPGESGAARAVVVEAPPHPRFGGSRSNRLLRAVADALVERGLAAMRFDYGEWDDGRGERADVENAIRWGAERYDRVGAFGYSFGGAMVALAAGSVDRPLCGVSLLAPAAQVADFDPFDTLAAIAAPLQVVYGSRDETAAWESIVEAARERGASVAQFEGDHFFVGQQAAIGESVADHLVGSC